MFSKWNLLAFPIKRLDNIVQPLRKEEFRWWRVELHHRMWDFPGGDKNELLSNCRRCLKNSFMELRDWSQSSPSNIELRIMSDAMRLSENVWAYCLHFWWCFSLRVRSRECFSSIIYALSSMLLSHSLRQLWADETRRKVFFFIRGSLSQPWNLPSSTRRGLRMGFLHESANELDTSQNNWNWVLTAF